MKKINFVNNSEPYLSAENFNQLQTNIEEAFAKNVISASLKSDYTLTTTNTYELIPLDDFVSVGDKLTLENNKIKIGAGITKILISARVGLPGATVGSKNFVIRKSGTICGRVWTKIDTAHNECMVINNTLIDAKENDLIDIALYGNVGDRISANAVFTILTVEVVA